MSEMVKSAGRALESKALKVKVKKLKMISGENTGKI